MGIRRRVVIAVITIVAAVFAAGPAWAGGWAVVTLDSLPAQVQAGEVFTIGFTVRQHGMTPISDLDPPPSVEARNPATGKVILSTAYSGGGPGHYTAQLVLPSVGEWEWGIQAFGGQVQPMPNLYVSTASEAIAPADAATIMLPWIAACLAIAGILLAFRRRFAISAGLIALAAAAGALGFIGSEPSAQIAEAAPLELSEIGEALFLAKGCTVCHMNANLPDSGSASISIGPDLSRYRNDPVFLKQWLAGPASVRPTTGMPNLHLSAGEIEALIEFLNRDPSG